MPAGRPGRGCPGIPPPTQPVGPSGPQAIGAQPFTLAGLDPNEDADALRCGVTAAPHPGSRRLRGNGFGSIRARRRGHPPGLLLRAQCLVLHAYLWVLYSFYIFTLLLLLITKNIVRLPYTSKVNTISISLFSRPHIQTQLYKQIDQNLYRDLSRRRRHRFFLLSKQGR